ncbi:uncharacterized protein AB9W97_010219 isoform 1-T1 [Spinachia spinachia]
MLLLLSCAMAAAIAAEGPPETHYRKKNDSLCLRVKHSPPHREARWLFNTEAIAYSKTITPKYEDKVFYYPTDHSLCINNLTETDSGLYTFSFLDFAHFDSKETHRLVVEETVPRPVVRLSALHSNRSAARCDITVNCSIGDGWAWSVCDVAGCRTSQRSNRTVVVINIFSDNASIVCGGENHVSASSASESTEATCLINPEETWTPPSLVVIVTMVAVCVSLCVFVLIVSKGILPTGRSGHQCSSQAECPRVPVDVRMGHTLFAALGLFSLNILLYCGHAQDALLHIEPNWSTFFTGEKVTFICDSRGENDTDWYYLFRIDGGWLTSYLRVNRYTTSSLTTGDSGEYQCVAYHSSFSGRESNKVSLRVSARPEARLSKDSPVEGRVTLTCSVGSSSSSSSSSSSGWKYFWYRDLKTSEPLKTGGDVLLQGGSFSPPGGGVHWCRGGRGDPVYYTEYSDPVDPEEAALSSVSLVLLVLGLVSGVSLIILLLLLFLCRCRKSNAAGLSRSQRTNQSPATDHMTNQGETHYASLLHGDSCLYEAIGGSEKREQGTNEEPEESVYQNVTMETAAGKSRCVAAEEAVYSEVKPGAS